MQQAESAQSAGAIQNPGAAASEILIIRQSDLRGFVLALGALEALRKAHPRARITLIAAPELERFANLCPYVDTVHTDLQHDDKRQRAARLTELRRTSFDMVYDLDGDVGSETLLRSLKPRFASAPPSSGPTASATFSAASKPGTVSEVQRLSGQLILAGVEFDRLPEPELAWVRHKLGNPPRLSASYFGISGPFALISINDETAGNELHWPQASVTGLCRRLADRGITPVITGEPTSGVLAQTVEMEVREAKNVLARADAGQLISLSEAALCVIGPDSPAIQIAGLLSTPCLVLSTTKAARAGIDTPYRSQFITVHAKKIGDIEAETLWQTLTCWERTGLRKTLEESPPNRHIAV